MNARTLLLGCSICSLASLLTLSGCGGAAVPQEALTAAQADVKGAEVGGAAENPKAMLHLKLAKDQIAEAEKLIKDGDNEQAARTLDRAQADAELALSLAKAAKAESDANDAKEQVGQLKKQINK